LITTQTKQVHPDMTSRTLHIAFKKIQFH